MDIRLNHDHTPLFTALTEHSGKKSIHMDVPGHKQGAGSLELTDYFGERMLRADINSMYGMDNLLNPQGVIRDAEILAADLFKADAAFFMVNGTTSAIQTMILAACRPGDKIIIPRNVHKSIINAMIISGAFPVYVQPKFSYKLGLTLGVTEQDYIKAINDNKDAKAVLIINPTYYGFVCDVAEVAKEAHKYDMSVLADEAHGTHFYFHPDLPSGSIEAGADMAGLSVHKTGGSLTQSSILLLKERYFSKNYIKSVSNITQTTSASYLLMASLDVARKQLAKNGRKMYQKVIDIAEEIRYKVGLIPGYVPVTHVTDDVGMYGYDSTKVVFNIKRLDITGIHMFDILASEYDIYAEFGDSENILFIPGIGSSFDEIPVMVNALSLISKKYSTRQKQLFFKPWCNVNLIYSPREAFYMPKKRILFKEAIGRVSAEFVMFYPPGIPILAPGELITQEAYEYIRLLVEENAAITGIEDSTAQTVLIVE